MIHSPIPTSAWKKSLPLHSLSDISVLHRRNWLTPIIGNGIGDLEKRPCLNEVVPPRFGRQLQCVKESFEIVDQPMERDLATGELVQALIHQDELALLARMSVVIGDH